MFERSSVILKLRNRSKIGCFKSRYRKKKQVFEIISYQKLKIIQKLKERKQQKKLKVLNDVLKLKQTEEENDQEKCYFESSDEESDLEESKEEESCVGSFEDGEVYEDEDIEDDEDEIDDSSEISMIDEDNKPAIYLSSSNSEFMSDDEDEDFDFREYINNGNDEFVESNVISLAPSDLHDALPFEEVAETKPRTGIGSAMNNPLNNMSLNTSSFLDEQYLPTSNDYDDKDDRILTMHQGLYNGTPNDNKEDIVEAEATLNEATNVEDLERSMDEADVEALMAMQFRDTLLQQHIQDHNLDLVPREATRIDGNCWYDAIADQIVLHQVPDMPTNHIDLRIAVCEAIPKLPQAKDWITNLFGDEETFQSFLKDHRQLGTWTDAFGIMCQSTALYVGRNIHIVGTANIGQGFAFTKLESIEGADEYSPFTVGYYQDKHYQSLQKRPIVEEFEVCYDEKLLDESFVSQSGNEGEEYSYTNLSCSSQKSRLISNLALTELLEDFDETRKSNETVIKHSKNRQAGNVLDRLCFNDNL